MESNKESNNLPNNMDIVVVIDKEKLPEDVRKILEENLPKDVKEQLKPSQEEVLKMLGRPPPVSDTQVPDKSDKSTSDGIDNNLGDKLKDNRLFAIQTGTVVGNIYTDGTYKKEEDSYIKNKDISEQLKLSLEQLKLSKDLGGCC